MREAATICPRLCKLTFDLLILKVMPKSRVTWATSVPILVFLGLSVLDLGPMYATDRQTSDVRQHHRLMPPPIRGGGIIIGLCIRRAGSLRHRQSAPLVDIDRYRHYIRYRQVYHAIDR